MSLLISPLIWTPPLRNLLKIRDFNITRDRSRSRVYLPARGSIGHRETRRDRECNFSVGDLSRGEETKGGSKGRRGRLSQMRMGYRYRRWR